MTQVHINNFNLNSALLSKHKNIIFHNSHWHKIRVDNVEDLDRDAVLSSLMNFCYPLHFIPVRYESTKNKASFLMKNCGPAIEHLCKEKLTVPNPLKKDRPFKISMVLCFANANDMKINIQDNVINVLNKRFNRDTGLLNLENFRKDSELDEYCPLSQPKLLFYILHLTKNIKFKSLKLSSNDIESLKPIEALQGLKLTALDLRNNNIKLLSELSSLKDLDITELWLDGNPICDDYDEYSYSRAIADHLEKLEKLDGVTLQLKGFLPFRRNFICNQTGYELVDQFLEHYFTLYDANNRLVLEGMYHKDALLSLTTSFIAAQSTSQAAKLTVYKKMSRNLRHFSNASNTEFLYFGAEILKRLNSLPPSEHDPYSFTVDLIMYTEKTAVLVVSGVFRELSERLLGFTRTFVLLAGQNGEYSIVNEMMHIANATTMQSSRAFKQIKKPRSGIDFIPPPQNDMEMLEMAEALKTISGMNLGWSRKCLEETKYDFRRALMLFVELFKIDKIPSSAFDCSSDKYNTNQNQTQQANQAVPPASQGGNVNTHRPTVPITNVQPIHQPTIPNSAPMQRPMMPVMGGMQQVNHPNMGNIQPPIPPIPRKAPADNLRPKTKKPNYYFQIHKNARAGLVNILLNK